VKLRGFRLIPLEEETMAKQKRTALWIVLKLLVAAGLIAYLIYSKRIDFGVLGRAGDRWPLLLGGGFGFLISLNLLVVRWRLLLRSQGIRLSYWEAFKLTFIGNFFNFFMLGAVGGDVIKIYYVVKTQREKKAEAGTTVFVDRLIGLTTLILVSLTAGILNYPIIRENEPLRQFLLWIVAGVVAAALFSLILLSDALRRSVLGRWIKKILPFREILKRIYETFNSIKRNWRTVLLTIGVSYVMHSITISLIFLFGIALGERILGLADYLFLVPFGFLINAIPITPAGLGVGELGFDLLFKAAGAQEHNLGAMVCAVFRIVSFLWGLLGAVFFIQNRKQIVEAERLAREEAEKQKEEAT
jgi:uncharacterized protein (TIRG00374 family)